MLSGKRAAVTHHQIGRPVDEFSVFSNSPFGLEVEVDSHVNAPMPKMAVERASITVFVHKRTDIPKVPTQLFWRDRRILPTFPLRGSTRDCGCSPRARFAYLPYRLGLTRRINPHAWCIRYGFQPCHKL